MTVISKETQGAPFGEEEIPLVNQGIALGNEDTVLGKLSNMREISEKEGEALFALGLIHQKNGNLVQARNCFLNSLCGKDPHPGSGHKLIEVHRKIVQHGPWEESRGLDREFILRALQVSDDKLAMKKYLAELSLREGDFHAALEQVSECGGADAARSRQFIGEIAANLFSDAPRPEHPTTLWINIWDVSPLSSTWDRKNVVDWICKWDEIPDGFVHVNDGRAVLRAALERAQLGKSFGFVVHQQIFGIRSAIELSLSLLEAETPSKNEIIGNLLEIDRARVDALESATLVKIWEICNRALAAPEQEICRVFVGHLLKLANPDALIFLYLAEQAMTAFCHRMIRGTEQTENEVGWLEELTELIEYILTFEKRAVPAWVLSEVVAPLFQCLAKSIVTPKWFQKAHAAVRLAPYLRDDNQGSPILQSLAKSRPEFIALCRRESQIPLFR